MTANEMSRPPELPKSSHVDIAILVSLLYDTTKSYKFFSSSPCLTGSSAGGMKGDGDSGYVIPLDELAVDMVVKAWYPYRFCRLSFGPQDMLQRVVDEIEWDSIRGSWIEEMNSESGFIMYSGMHCYWFAPWHKKQAQSNLYRASKIRP